VYKKNETLLAFLLLHILPESDRMAIMNKLFFGHDAQNEILLNDKKCLFFTRISGAPIRPERFVHLEAVSFCL
jgi:hypothetical protein